MELSNPRLARRLVKGSVLTHAKVAKSYCSTEHSTDELALNTRTVQLVTTGQRLSRQHGPTCSSSSLTVIIGRLSASRRADNPGPVTTLPTGSIVSSIHKPGEVALPKHSWT